MALGRPAFRPFSQRILAPWVAGQLPLGLPLLTRFELLDLACLLVAALSLSVIARRLGAGEIGVSAIVGLYLLSPFGIRWAVNYPANTDHIGNALLFAWLACLLAPGRVRWLALPTALLAVLAREGNAPLIVVGGLLTSRDRFLGVTTGLCGVAAYLLVRNLPGINPPSQTCTSASTA